LADTAIEIGEFRLDATCGMLSRAGVVVPVRAKTFAFLCHLAHNRGRVVSKEELLEAVWPGLFVSEDSLTQCVSELRKVLGADGLLKTVPKRGYVLASAVPPATAEQTYPSLAILPFRNRAADGADDAIIDGMVEEITFGLARFKSIVVIARNSAFAFPVDQRPSLAEIGKALGAEFIVEGSVLRRAGRLLVSVSLSHAPSGQRVWGNQFDFAETDLFTVNAEIAATIILRLVSNIDQAVLQQPAPPANLAAFENFARGVAFLRGYGPGVNKRARDHFLKAIEIDPDCALAHAYLALADIIIADYAAAPRAVLEAARDRAMLAVTLEPEESRCYRIMGLVRLYLREHEAAEQFLRRAHDLNPYDADALAQLGFVRSMRGWPEEGATLIRKAIALNPFRPFWYDGDLAYTLYALGSYEEAAEVMARSPDAGPFHTMWLAAAQAMSGRLDAAAMSFEKLMSKLQPTDIDQCCRDWTEFEHEADLAHFQKGVRIAEQAFRDRALNRGAAQNSVAGTT
jgi:TolB-like protein/Tfp pilus assembly protein PilF